LIRTFETRLDLRTSDISCLGPVLCEYASVMARAERLLLARLKAGRVWTGDLKVSFYQPLGLSANSSGHGVSETDGEALVGGGTGQGAAERPDAEDRLEEDRHRAETEAVAAVDLRSGEDPA
jgi:hypothetical protein